MKMLMRNLALCVGLLVLTARADLPEGYTALDGIQSTSAGKQYILTDYVPSSCNVKIEADVTLSAYSTQGIWCSRTGTNAKTLTLFCWAASNYFRLDRNSSTSVYAEKGPAVGTKATLKADYGALTFAIDGVDVGKTMASGDFTPEAKLAFFASHMNGSSWGNFAVMTLHGVRIYAADGTLEREFVPVQCAANAGQSTEFGLYETTGNGAAAGEGRYFSSGSSFAFTPVVEATATWTEDAEADALVLTVLGTYELTDADAARINGTTCANLVKRGSGTVIGAPIPDFKGNLTVESGVYRLAHQYDCGADSNGWIRVCEGATLEIRGFADVTNPRALTGKTIYTSGNGYNNMGAIAGGCSWNSCSKCRFILEGDSYYTADGELNFIDYIDLAGHTLKGRQATTWQRWGLSGNTITNSAATPAAFEFVGGLLRSETMSTFRGTATDGTVTIASDSSSWVVCVPTYGLTSAWPLQLGPKASYSARGIANPTNSEYGTLKGPLTFSGAVRLATDVRDGIPSIANVKGTLTGSGTTDIGGWVNYHTTANDYAGTVTVVRSNEFASAAYRAGIGLKAGAVYSAAQTTFVNADLDLTVGAAQTLRGSICFTGDDQCRLTGGNPAGDRAKLALVRKEGAGELLLSGGVSVTGRLEVASGTVRFPTRADYLPVVGKPGLMGSITNEVIWSFTSPDEDGCVYDTYYPKGLEINSRWDGTNVLGPRTTFARGYVWNRTDADARWTFKPNHNDCIWLWIDGVQIFSAQRTSWDNLQTVTLTPGPHRIEIITTSSQTSSGPLFIKWVNGLGSLYDSLPVDFEGRGETTAANYAQFLDPGDGSLFTVDAATTEELTDPFWLADIDTMAFAPGTVFDVGGYDYAVTALEGFPTISNVGTFTVRSSWLLDDAGIAAGRPLAVAGTLVCDAGAVIGLKTPWSRLSPAALTQLDAGLTIATAAAFAGTPALSDELRAAGAELSLAADGLSLELRVPADRYVKAVADGVEIAYAMPAGRSRREVRIDIYRDGVLVDQKFLGNASGVFSGVWRETGDGYYFATATVVDENGEDYKTTFGEQLVSGANMVFVSPEAAEGEYTSVRAAVDALGAAGGRVYVRPGRYAEVYGENAETGLPLTNGVEIASAIQVIGLTDDPSRVTVTRQSGNRMRIFLLGHADAALRFLTIEGGYQACNSTITGNGGNVFVNEEGGTIENCVIRDGSTSAGWPAGGGNVALFNGRMRNCVLTGGENSTDTTNIWVNCGGSLLVFQRTAACAPAVENCLITACTSTSRSGSAPVGLYGNATLVNCTVAGNASNLSGALMLSKGNNLGTFPRIVNCAFFDNTMRATPATDRQIVYEIQANYQNNVANTMTAEEAAACFVNCAAPVALNETCVATDAPGFADAAKGDYALTAASPLVDRGYETSAVEGIGRYDLLGSPRFVKGVDIGCCEYRAPRFRPTGLYFILR
ncbi:MAG: hypothetical protein ACI4Q3_01155 [Kiritimatiellia bacterium]